MGAIISILEKGKNKEVYNVGSSKVVEIKKLAQTIGNMYDCKPLCSQYDSNTAKGLIADITKLKSLGFNQKVSFEQGLKLC